HLLMACGKNARTVVTVASVAFTALLVMVGCGKNEGSGSAASNTDLVAAGKAVFDANNCARCHIVAGQGNPRGRDLTRVGADPKHTMQWLIEHVKNPRAHNPNSTMPAFEGKISEQDLKALGAYLSSLK
ncbi:MAG: cytochrome c, partial [Abditibacteriales bacterium]|nr:cytochrome c [Abditibacteriales bacterium]MDW8365505.1 c-type cytochrome [Abditibacteriales bacterium]